MKAIAWAITTLCGTGYLPASGTWASALVALLWLYLPPISWYWHIAGIALLFLLAVWACNKYLADKNSDPPEIVIDEALGMWIALVFVPAQWQYVLLAFAGFRLLDIVKPGPIGWLDNNVKGSIGILADDVAAGAVCMLGAMVLAVVTDYIYLGDWYVHNARRILCLTY